MNDVTLFAGLEVVKGVRREIVATFWDEMQMQKGVHRVGFDFDQK